MKRCKRLKKFLGKVLEKFKTGNASKGERRKEKEKRTDLIFAFRLHPFPFRPALSVKKYAFRKRRLSGEK